MGLIACKVSEGSGVTKGWWTLVTKDEGRRTKGEGKEQFSSCCRATPAWPQKQIRGEGGAPELVMAQFEKIPQGLKPKDFISRIFGTTQVVPCYKTIQTEPVSPNFIPSGEML
jgi:hypothetical protein